MICVLKPVLEEDFELRGGSESVPTRVDDQDLIFSAHALRRGEQNIPESFLWTNGFDVELKGPFE